jgi:hypothetical protein
MGTKNFFLKHSGSLIDGERIFGLFLCVVLEPRHERFLMSFDFLDRLTDPKQ